ncbi:NADH-quinone oxidoreductase subunit C [Desulfosporosinus burensis]
MDGRIKEIDTQMYKTFGSDVSMIWEEDTKKAIWGHCYLPDPEMIHQVALLVAAFRGRVITITPYLHGEEDTPKKLSIAYHFDIRGVTITSTITLKDGLHKVKSITPVLKSADWNEREMQEMYHVTVEGHPNPQRLFLDDSINLTEDTMVPLSMAMSGATSTTLWEKVMGSPKEGMGKDE